MSNFKKSLVNFLGGCLPILYCDIA